MRNLASSRRVGRLALVMALGWLGTMVLTACGEEATATVNKDVSLPRDRVLMLSNRDGWPDLYTVDLTGKVAGRLTETPAAEYAASWSPDGRKVAFVELNG